MSQVSARGEALRAWARETTGFLTEPEGEALAASARAAAHLGVGPLIEIGAYQGRSTLYLAAGLADALAEGATANLLVSVDHHRGSEEMQAGWPHHDPSLVDPRSGRMDSLPSFRRTIEDALAEDLVVALVGDSARAAGLIAEPVALVFLDGGHGEATQRKDYEAWWPKLAGGGLLAIHDVFEDPRDGGRPPYDCFRDAIDRRGFVEVGALGVASLRVLRRQGAPPTTRQAGH